MSGISSAGGSSFYGSEVRTDERDMAAGRVSFGGVSISATDAAEFVMMHRTEVLKQVGVDRTELAEKHLATIRKARQYKIELTDMKKFGEDRNHHGRIPVTPEMINFLKNDVGCSPGEYNATVTFYGSAVAKLPKSVREYYGFTDGWEGRAASWTDSINEGHGLATGFGFAGLPDQGGTSAAGSDSDGQPDHGIRQAPGFGSDGHHNQYQLPGATVLYKGDIDTVKEELDNYIDQLNDSNNLYMTKFKNVVNTMNEALDGANSMADKSHDTVKNLVSRW